MTNDNKGRELYRWSVLFYLSTSSNLLLLMQKMILNSNMMAFEHSTQYFPICLYQINNFSTEESLLEKSILTSPKI